LNRPVESVINAQYIVALPQTHAINNYLRVQMVNRQELGS